MDDPLDGQQARLDGSIVAEPVATKKAGTIPPNQGADKGIPARAQNSPNSGAASTGRSQRLLTRRQSGRTFALIAFTIGALVGSATYAVNRLAVGAPQAHATVILDERQVHWPFYGAAYAQAESIIGTTEAFEAARSVLSDPSAAQAISLKPSTDQSVLIVTANASTDAAAIALVDAAAAELVNQSMSSRQAIEAVAVQRLSDDVDALITNQKQAEALLRVVDNDVDRLIAEKDLEHTSERLNLKKTSLQEANEKLDNAGPLFISVGTAEIQGQVTQSILASISAGAGSMVLVLLAFSLLCNSPDED